MDDRLNIPKRGGIAPAAFAAAAVGAHTDCKAKTLRERTFSPISTAVSPSLNLLTVILPSPPRRCVVDRFR